VHIQPARGGGSLHVLRIRLGIRIGRIDKQRK
jgi:hypothetical protein